jgi:hypothetical protein
METQNFKRLIDQNREMLEKISRLEWDRMILRDALHDIAHFSWLSWSVDYSPKTIARDALKKTE